MNPDTNEEEYNHRIIMDVSVCEPHIDEIKILTKYDLGNFINRITGGKLISDSTLKLFTPLQVRIITLRIRQFFYLSCI